MWKIFCVACYDLFVKMKAVNVSNDKSQTCYLSAAGSKYHRINNCGRMNPNKATQTTVGQAEASRHDHVASAGK